MPNVAEVKQNPKKPENAFVKFDDGTDAWCPDFEKASTLVIGQPLPDGWRQDVGDYGPRVFPPNDKKGGGGGGKAAWANTEDGERFVQERMDRRTALMQAVTHVPVGSPAAILTEAEKFYAWLRKSSGVAPLSTANPPSTVAPDPQPAAPAQAAGGKRAAAAKAGTQTPASAAPRCPSCGSEEVGFTPDKSAASCLTCGQEWQA